MTTKKIISSNDKLKKSNYESNSEDEGEGDANKNDRNESGIDFFQNKLLCL